MAECDATSAESAALAWSGPARRRRRHRVRVRTGARARRHGPLARSPAPAVARAGHCCAAYDPWRLLRPPPGLLPDQRLPCRGSNRCRDCASCASPERAPRATASRPHQLRPLQPPVPPGWTPHLPSERGNPPQTAPPRREARAVVRDRRCRLRQTPAQPQPARSAAPFRARRRWRPGFSEPGWCVLARSRVAAPLATRARNAARQTPAHPWSRPPSTRDSCTLQRALGEAGRREAAQTGPHGGRRRRPLQRLRSSVRSRSQLPPTDWSAITFPLRCSGVPSWA